jgi:formamidopyrimidine-DNA glycosylase
MPELPETETIARDLNALVSGAHIEAATVRRPDVLRGITAKSLRSRITGAKIVRFWRRAKLIVGDLSTEDRLVVQPRFTGALLLDDGNLAPDALQYSTLSLALADGRVLHYCDVRRLGTVALLSPTQFTRYVSGLGVEPLDQTFTATQLSGIVRASRQAVKKLLMDQRRIAGVGNIYANEALWRSGIDPSRIASSLSLDEVTRLRDELVASLSESIAARGTTFRDFRDAAGNRGSYASQLRAYGRGGLPCLRCGTRLFETHAIDGRTTVICGRCQR